MFVVEVYASVRQFVFIDGQSRREAARVFGLSRETIAKMCRFSLPPVYTRSKPKLGPLLPVIAAILEGTGLYRSSDAIRPSGSSSAYATSTAMPVAIPW